MVLLTRVRQSYFAPYLWLALSLVIFNLSIDIPDPHSDAVSEDLTVNDIESISELVIEKLLGFENAFVEYDDHDLEDEGGFCKKVDFKFYQQLFFHLYSFFITDVKKNLTPFTIVYFQSPALLCLIKPPQV